MGDVHYAAVINDMTWSYSRIKTYEACPYRWYLKYLCECSSKPMFFSGYGIFMHKLIEQYYRGDVSKACLRERYLCEFAECVPASAPSQKVFESYFLGGLAYLDGITPLPYRVVQLEMRVDTSICGKGFLGFIDFLGEKDGELFLVDHKSRSLKKRSSRALRTKGDVELDDYLKQLYLYSHAVSQKYGRFPKALCFNCFRTQQIITEPFCNDAYITSLQWFFQKTEEIAATEHFRPSIEFFKCRHLCEMQDHCEYYRTQWG